MQNTELPPYECSNCGYTNVWTRDEILQRGESVLYRGDDTETFSLPCKNPTLNCSHRTLVKVPVPQK